jgi:hypothetical protein
VREVTEGWRSLDRYRTQGIDATALLDSGSGVFLDAPDSILAAVRQLLEEAGLVVHEVGRVSPSSPVPKALVLGSNFVIANSFATER